MAVSHSCEYMQYPACRQPLPCFQGMSFQDWAASEAMRRISRLLYVISLKEFLHEGKDQHQRIHKVGERRNT
ncbi:MAG: hypothetical protein LWW84_10015, partial [Azovibrio sp.]|nr:hypothetical protein [Azovibrio sp.]